MELLEILRNDVKPALGCTGPISVAFATAAAKDAVGGTPKSIRVLMDRDTYKNSIAVVTPGTSFMGVLEPSVVGAFYGESKLGMEVLANMKDPDEDFIRKFAKEHTSVEIIWEYKGMGVLIEAYVETENGTGHVIVANAHDRIVLLEANGKILQKDESYDPKDTAFEKKGPIRDYGVKDFYEFAKTVDISTIPFIAEAIDLNVKLANAGIEEQMGGKFGIGIGKLQGNQMYLKAKALAAAASDARMSGKKLSAMSCAKSGNVGIAASLPLVAVAEGLGKSREELIRAVCLSYFMTIYVKAHIGRLSAMCACAIAASIGVGAGTSFLMGDGLEQIGMTVKNLVGSIGGILCDGAKFGCAMKLSSAAGIAIESAQLAHEGVCIPDRDGLVCTSADETIAMLGRIAANGMLYTDEYMCKEIIDRESAL